jgi:hypothetical protein
MQEGEATDFSPASQRLPDPPIPKAMEVLLSLTSPIPGRELCDFFILLIYFFKNFKKWCITVLLCDVKTRYANRRHGRRRAFFPHFHFILLYSFIFLVYLK